MIDFLCENGIIISIIFNISLLLWLIISYIKYNKELLNKNEMLARLVAYTITLENKIKVEEK